MATPAVPCTTPTFRVERFSAEFVAITPNGAIPLDIAVRPAVNVGHHCEKEKEGQEYKPLLHKHFGTSHSQTQGQALTLQCCVRTWGSTSGGEERQTHHRACGRLNSVLFAGRQSELSQV